MVCVAGLAGAKVDMTDYRLRYFVKDSVAGKNSCPMLNEVENPDLGFV